LQARPFLDILIQEGQLKYNQGEFMLNKLIHLAIFGTLLLSACTAAPTTATLPENTNTPEPATGNLPALNGSWTISMTHSGGIMGLMRSVDVDSSGAYTVQDSRGEQSFTGQLSDEELANLIQVVNATEYNASGKPHGCADCFVYNIKISGEGGKFSAQVDDTSMEESGLTSLIVALRNIIAREIK
jgi:hypothetical protein